MSGATQHAEPGLRGVVPFRFACHRCGHCCSGGSGHVWLEPGEIESMAARMGCSAESFTRRHVRNALDPRTGSQRPALRESDDAGGRCALLVGRNQCGVYDARPQHCRTFPYWESVLAGGVAFESARATCPGIAVEVEPDRRERAFADLRVFLERVGEGPRRADCCLDTRTSETVFATALEADFALSAAPARNDACRLGDRRPLACRLDARADGEAALRELRAIERAHGYPAAYAALGDLLGSRGLNMQTTERTQEEPA